MTRLPRDVRLALICAALGVALIAYGNWLEAREREAARPTIQLGAAPTQWGR